MRLLLFLIPFLVASLPAREIIFPILPARISTTDTNDIAVHRQLNVKPANGGTLPLPFIALGSDTLIARGETRLEARHTEDYLLYMDGIPGSATVFINQQRVFQTSLDWLPVRHKIPPGILKTGPNRWRVVFHARSAWPPVFNHLFAAPFFNGLAGSIRLIKIPHKRISNFSYTITRMENKAHVRLRFRVTPDFRIKEGHALEVDVRNNQGQSLYKNRRPLLPDAGTYSEEITLPTGALWEPAHPVHLTVSFRLKRFLQTLGREDITVGFRTARVTDSAFFLNGQRFRFKGINLYFNPMDMSGRTRNDYYGAVLKKVRQAGYNAVRFPGYVPPESVFTLADSLGLLLLPELPVSRFPADWINNETFLNATRAALQQLMPSLGRHPSFFALGLGNELDADAPVNQRYFLISNDPAMRIAPLLTYIAPLKAGHGRNTGVDFMLYAPYRPFTEWDTLTGSSLPAHAGRFIRRHASENYAAFALDKSRRLSQWAQNDPSARTRGYFSDAFNDMPVRYSGTIQDTSDAPYPVEAVGFLSAIPEEQMTSLNIKDSLATLSLPPNNVPISTHNFFAIVIFVWTLIFLFFFRRYPNFRENFKRAMRRSYGFFVDMREWRIIPVFNTLMIGINSAFVLGVFCASLLYYAGRTLFFHEWLAIFTPDPVVYGHILRLLNNKGWLVTAAVPLFLLYPLMLAVLIKLWAILKKRYIRFRQAVAIGTWSGAPLAFMMPLSMITYHALVYQTYVWAALTLAALFIIWSHYRLINGIRVLLVIRFGAVFMILLLSYIVTMLIFFALFNPQPHWFEQLQTLINSRTLY